MLRSAFLAALLLFVCPLPPAAAQSGLPPSYTGPAPPLLPKTMSRDAEGRVTIRAVRVTVPLRIDGQLDDALYSSVQPMTDFIQAEPAWGEPATEKTEVWIAFDDENIYIGFRAWETHPERMLADEMRRDSNSIPQNDHFGIALDTFFDHRTSFNFHVNAVGGRWDGQVMNEADRSGDWNPVWEYVARRTDTGWTGEAAIPFKSIRYQPKREQVWGVQLRRANSWKNEVSFLSRVPRGYERTGIYRLNEAATLVGIEVPPSRPPLDVKPYVISDVTTDRTATPAIQNDFGKDFGLDVKYGVTRGLTADFTYNTDFAQVEADEQQVNLTRFSLFFPEKRDFFLENAGAFATGGVNVTQTTDVPILFYSRRIGLDRGREVPIEAGGRLSGRIGPYSLGLINIQTKDVDAAGIPSTNFSVVSVRRDVFRRSRLGAIATRRSIVSGGTGAGETYGVDGAFSFFTNLAVNTYWARTLTPGLRGDDTSYRGELNYTGDRYGIQIEQLNVGDHFNPEIGFLRRDDFTKSRLFARFSPRPRRRFKSVRRFFYQGDVEYWSNGAGLKEQRELVGEFQIEFQNADTLKFGFEDLFERVPASFRIAPGVTVPAGGYDRRTFTTQYGLGRSHRSPATLIFEDGPFYDGHRTAFSYTGGRVTFFGPHFAVEPRVSIDRVTLPYGDFTSRLIGSRVTYTITPAMFVSSLVQYNSTNNSLGTNLRMRWEYRPGSELFIVYNDGRDTTGPGSPVLQSRAVVVKINRLLRF